jgi:hypothetical protein
MNNASSVEVNSTAPSAARDSTANFPRASLFHQAKQAIVASQVDSLGVRENSNGAARAENHPNSRNSNAASCSVSPSIGIRPVWRVADKGVG